MAPRRESTTATASLVVEETCNALRRWFRGLSPLERLLALAIQDAAWVKMYIVLAHMRPMQWVAEMEFEKEYVKAIFHKLQKQSDGTNLLDSVLSLPSPPSAFTETTGLPSSNVITSHPSTFFGELQQGSMKLLCGSLKRSKVNSSDQCEGGHEASNGGEHDHLDPTVEVGNKLQETIRLCGIRSTTSEQTSNLDTIIVLEEMLVNTNSFLNLVSQASRSGFLSTYLSAVLKSTIKSDSPNTSGEEQFLDLPWLQCHAYSNSTTISLTDLLVNRLELALWTSYWSTMKQHEAKWQQVFSLFPSPVLFTTPSMVEERENECETELKVISPSFATSTVKGVIAAATGRSPSQPPASELNTFALATATAEATAPILDVLQTRTALVQFWNSRPTVEKLELVKSFQPAIDEIKEERGKSNGRIVEKLLLPPLSWVAKDCGQGVRVALNSIRAAYAADCAMEELLALEMGKHVCTSSNNSLVRESCPSNQNRMHNQKNATKKMKKKGNHHTRLPKGPQKQRQQNGAPPCSRGKVTLRSSSSELEDSLTTLSFTSDLDESSDNGCCRMNTLTTTTKNIDDDVPKGAVATACALGLATPKSLVITVNSTIDGCSTTSSKCSGCLSVHNINGDDLPTMTSSPEDDLGLNPPNGNYGGGGCGGAGASENMVPYQVASSSTDTSGDCEWKVVVSQSRRKKEKAGVRNERHHYIELGKEGKHRCCNRQLSRKHSGGGWNKRNKKGGMMMNNNSTIMATTKLKQHTTPNNGSSMLLRALNCEGSVAAAVSNPLTPGCGMNGQEQQENSSKCYSLVGYPSPIDSSAPPPQSQSFIEASPHISSASCDRRMEAVVSDNHSVIIPTSVAHQHDRTLAMETGSTVSTDPTQPPSPPSVCSATSAAFLGLSEHPLPPQSGGQVNSHQYGSVYMQDNKKSLLSFADVVKAQSRENDGVCNSIVHHKEGDEEDVQLYFKMDGAPSSSVEEVRRRKRDYHHGSARDEAAALVHPPPSIRDCTSPGGIIEEEESSRRNGRVGGVTRREFKGSSSSGSTLPFQSLDLKRNANTSTDEVDHADLNDNGDLLSHDNDENGYNFDSIIFGSSPSSTAADKGDSVSHEVDNSSCNKHGNFATSAPENEYTTSTSTARPRSIMSENVEEERCDDAASAYLTGIVIGDDISNRVELPQSSPVVLNEKHNVDNDMCCYLPPPDLEGHRGGGDVGPPIMGPKKRDNDDDAHGKHKQQHYSSSTACKMQARGDEIDGNENEMRKSTRSVSQRQNHQQQEPATKTSMKSVTKGGRGECTTKKQNLSNSRSHHNASLVNMQQGGVRRAEQSGTAASAANPSGCLWMGCGLPPWTVYPDYSVYNEAALVKHLDANIEAFMKKLFSVMCLKRCAWRRIVDCLTKIVSNTWEEARVEVYGSCYTGLELPSSDVDVVICGIGGKMYEYGQAVKDPYNLEEAVGYLRQLATALECEPWIRGMKVIETASIPVIKVLADPKSMMTDSGVKCTGNPVDGDASLSYFSQYSSSAPSEMIDTSESAVTAENYPPCASYTICTPQGVWPWQNCPGTEYIPLDISFLSPMHGGIGSSKWVRENVQEGKYRCCVPTILIIKEMLCQRGLNQPWSGGLSSYSLVNMMITVLQEIEKQSVRDRKLEMFANSLKEGYSDSPTSDGGGGGTSLPIAAQQQPSYVNHSHGQPNGLTVEGGLVTVSIPIPTATGGSGANLDYVVGLTEQDLVEESLANVTPGLCLLRFLEFYGRAFNNHIYGISVGKGALSNPFLLENSVADQ